MKKFRIFLPVLAFVIAIGGAFGSVLVQNGFYDANGSSAAGGTAGSIDQIDKDCRVQNGTVCTIGGEWAFNSVINAENNQGGKSNLSAAGLLKYQ
jgi:hypothetical protein